MFTERKKKMLSFVLMSMLAIITVSAHYLFDPWGFYWKVPEAESSLRMSLIQAAECYLGYNEADGSHRQIVDLYNAQDVLPMDYSLQYTDSWCAAFVSTVAMQCGLTDIIPTECGCERQIGLFQSLGCWEESDDIIPLPGDLIYYDWNMEQKGECTGWADHVGIVVGTKWPFLKVIEGNYDDCVKYRYLLLNDIHIRGFAKPDYSAILGKTP